MIAAILAISDHGNQLTFNFGSITFEALYDVSVHWAICIDILLLSWPSGNSGTNIDTDQINRFSLDEWENWTRNRNGFDLLKKWTYEKSLMKATSSYETDKTVSEIMVATRRIELPFYKLQSYNRGFFLIASSRRSVLYLFSMVLPVSQCSLSRRKPYW